MIRWDVRAGGGEVGVAAPALVSGSQSPLFLLPAPLLFVPSRPVRINAMGRVRRMTVRYEGAGAVSGGFNHLVMTSLRPPAPKLPSTGSQPTFGSFHVAFLMSGATVRPADGAGSQQPVLSEARGRRSQQRKAPPKTPPGNSGNHSNTIHTYFKCTLQFFSLRLQPV